MEPAAEGDRILDRRRDCSTCLEVALVDQFPEAVYRAGQIGADRPHLQVAPRVGGRFPVRFLGIQDLRQMQSQ